MAVSSNFYLMNTIRHIHIIIILNHLQRKMKALKTFNRRFKCKAMFIFRRETALWHGRYIMFDQQSRLHENSENPLEWQERSGLSLSPWMWRAWVPGCGQNPATVSFNSDIVNNYFHIIYSYSIKKETLNPLQMLKCWKLNIKYWQHHHLCIRLVFSKSVEWQSGLTTELYFKAIILYQKKRKK